MRQTPPSPPPAPDAPPAPAQAGRTPISIAVPDGAIPLEGIPRTAADIRGLRERRDILRDHLERAGVRRSQLVDQLDGRGGPDLPNEARAGVQQRLDALDQRILQIESDQAMTERLLSQAPPAVLAQALAQQQQWDRSGMVQEEEAAFIGFSAFGAGIVLTLIVNRIRRGRARRKGLVPAAGVGATDPRIDRLTQAVDAIAEEVERIGEGQRFVTQLLASRPDAIAVPVLNARAGEAQAVNAAPYRP